MTTIDSIVGAAEALTPLVRERAADTEATRRLPPDVLDALRLAGCFRLLHPVTHGGLGVDLRTALEVYETLARADASTAWTVMIGSAAWIDLIGLPLGSFDALFLRERDVIVAGAFNPTGSIERDGDGYRVTGRWAFASGCQHATWIYANCVEGVVDDEPKFRIAVLAPDEVVIEDTWNVAGMRGTGSHHFHVDDVTVPAHRTLVPFVDPPAIDGPMSVLPIPAALSLCVASVALGIGQGALDDLMALAPTTTLLLAPGPLAASSSFQDTIARVDTDLRAARSLLHDAATTAWTAATDGRHARLDERGALRATATWTVERASAAVDAAHRAAGGAAIYADNTLQRRLRDIQTLRQHFLVRADTFAVAGAILAGIEPDIHIF
jgi:indole-3-acetate monooxygenase